MLLRSLVSLLFVCLFSILLLGSGDLVIFWRLVEVISLCFVPCFVCGGGVISLLKYLVASSISSVLVLLGVMYPSCYLFVEFGLFIKFGLFPFMGWVYAVFATCDRWLVRWALSCLLKISSLYLVYLLWGGTVELSVFLVIVRLILLRVNFWVFRGDWSFVWCHMMLSSSVVMFVLGITISMEQYL